MKNIRLTKLNTTFILGLILILSFGCERDVTDDAVPATFPIIGEVFTDAPVNLTDDFFKSFDPAGGANTEGFGTDENESYEGTTSIRIDVPTPFDPNGNFIGGIFKDRGAGRDLTGFDALTFWVKGSITANVGLFGFGTDFEESKYEVRLENVALSTDWRKVIIPIPDPSKLVQEKGMFIFSAGAYDVLQNDNPFDVTSFEDNVGFTMWIDEIRFEKLGTIGQPRATIFDGNTQNEIGFSGTEIPVTGLSYTVNLPSGVDQTVGLNPYYFSFESTDSSVADISLAGDAIEVLDEGSATITASVGGTLADGSLEVLSNGFFPSAPTPTQPAANVISVFSDAYTDEVTPNFTPGFGGSTTIATLTSANNDEYVAYSTNNFTGILWDDNPIDASAMQFMHVDVFVSDAATSVEFQIRDIGPNGMIETNIFTGQPEGDDADFRFTASGLTVGEWNQIEIPLAGNLASQKDNLGAVILAGGPDFFLDNIYFYTN